MAFPTTRWSLLAQATIHGDAMQREALAEFYRRYREPVVSYLRRHQPEARADDLSQEFFLHLIENSTLQRADPLRGRFRSFLLGALNRFLARTRVHEAAAKRGSGEAALSLDALTLGAGEPVVPAAVAEAFDRDWARSLIVRVRCQLSSDWRGKTTDLALFMRFLPGSVDTPAYEAAALTLGWSLARLKTEVFRLRQKFRDQVRQEVALTVETPHEIELEMAHLHLVLADPAA